jgi:hypothetical protein
LLELRAGVEDVDRTITQNPNGEYAKAVTAAGDDAVKALGGITGKATRTGVLKGDEA